MRRATKSDGMSRCGESPRVGGEGAVGKTTPRGPAALAALLLAAAACGGPSIADGALECSPDGECPPGFACGLDRRCWRMGAPLGNIDAQRFDSLTAPDAASPPDARLVACSDDDACTVLNDACGTATCDLVAGMCVKASTNEGGDCESGTMCEPATACGGFAEPCGESGSQQRICHDHKCRAGTCTPENRVETLACGRETDGVSCGSTSCGGWGGCGGFADTCDQDGVETRSCTGYSCVAGACTPGPFDETRGCTRSTEGVGCGADNCGGFGGCGGFEDTCDQDGTRSRTCWQRRCSGGGCADVNPYTDTQGCSRNTDGNSCGPDQCGAFGLCSNFSDVCDESGTQTRTCNPQVCGGGACGLGGGYTEMQDCTRDTDGWSCGAPCMIPGGEPRCCVSGTCQCC
jgi:hypothetical protein